MKRLICLLLCICLACPLTACGKDSGKKRGTENPSAAAHQALTESEKDTMHLNLLFSLVGTPDTGVTELLGDGEARWKDERIASRAFTGTIYGTAVAFTVYYNEYVDVSSVEAEFAPSVSEDDLADKITEVTGRSRLEDGTWHADNALVSLERTDGSVIMTLEAHIFEES